MGRRDHLYTGFVVMTIGILLLLGKFGIITWSAFSAFGQIWPLIIVAVGINLFFNNHVAVKILTFAGLVAAFVYFGITGPQNTDGLEVRFDGFHGSTPMVEHAYGPDPTVRSGALVLDVAAGSVEIDSTEAGLLETRLPEGALQENVSTVPGSGRRLYEYKGSGIVLGDQGNGEYGFSLGKAVPWDLNLTAGAMEADLDLTEVQIRNLEINSGAGDIEINLGSVAQNATLSADVKASDFRVTLPESVGFRAVINKGIHDVTIENNGYERNGNTYTSDNYETATERIELNLDVAVGDIQIVQE